jgi:hypothetical protein
MHLRLLFLGEIYIGPIENIGFSPGTFAWRRHKSGTYIAAYKIGIIYEPKRFG